MIHRRRVFADTRRQSAETGVRMTTGTGSHTSPLRHRYSLVTSGTIASPRNLTIPQSKLSRIRPFVHGNKPRILFDFGNRDHEGSPLVSFLFPSLDSILRASRIFHRSRISLVEHWLTTQFSNNKFTTPIRPNFEKRFVV